jgi:hypothetical protein
MLLHIVSLWINEMKVIEKKVFALKY